MQQYFGNCLYVVHIDCSWVTANKCRINLYSCQAFDMMRYDNLRALLQYRTWQTVQ